MDGSLEKKNNRLLWLDFGKAMGILMVLTVHAGASLGFLTFYGGLFYMPVFFVAAGYTYRSQREGSYKDFLKKKAGRLLLPYLGTSAFLWLFFWLKDSVLKGNPLDLKLSSLFGILYSRNQMFVPGYAGDNPVLLDLLNAPLWFLTAMFLVYAYYGLISRSQRKGLFLCLGLLGALLWHGGTRLLLPWSLDAVPYFACFFWAGEELRTRELTRLWKDWRCMLAALALFLWLGRILGTVNLSCGVYGGSMLLGLLVGGLGSYLVLGLGALLEERAGRLAGFFAGIGRETLWILCLHMFLFMFLRAFAGLLGLGEGLTRLFLIVGSAAALTEAGRLVRKFPGRRAP